jgi:hypothetical protein
MNALVRADATSLPIDRRAALGSLFSAGALLAAPHLAKAAEHPDAALFALQADIEAADAQLEAAIEALGVAERAYDSRKPEEPRCRMLKGASHLIWQQMWDAHEPAMRDWQADCQRLEVECGVKVAEELQGAAWASIHRVEERVAATRAITLAGMIFKASFAARNDGCEYETDVMISIIDDLLAMADRPQPAQLAAAA